MAVYRPHYKDPKTGELLESQLWWYDFTFAGRRIREPAKTHLKTLAKAAEQKRRRELEDGFNGIQDNRAERIRSIKELATAYLKDYKLRHKSFRFAEYALGHIKRLVGSSLVVDMTDKAVADYQAARLSEHAAPKTINEETGFLLRLLGPQGDVIRAQLRRRKALKLKCPRSVGKAFTPDEKAAMLAAAKASRSPVIFPALMLALNAGIRDAEIRGLQWGRLDLVGAVLTVGDSKTEAGEGRTIPLNSDLLAAMVQHSKWFTERFGMIRPEWYLFPGRMGKPTAGKERPYDPTRPMVTLKSAWDTVRTNAKVSGRWHDNRHTFITDLAESPEVSEETIREMAGHVSKQMLKHYSHVRMEAKRRAVEAITGKKRAPAATPEKLTPAPPMSEAKKLVKDSPKVAGVRPS